MSGRRCSLQQANADHCLPVYRLERRSHSTRHFLMSNGPNPLQVESFRFFQAAWDESVRGVFSEQLGESHDVYTLVYVISYVC